MKTFLILLLPLLLLTIGCSKTHECIPQDNHCKDAVYATLKNLSGLNACGWKLQLANGDYLEPINIFDFEIDLMEGKVVFVSYVVRTDIVSARMVGKIVEIKCIEEKDK